MIVTTEAIPSWRKLGKERTITRNITHARELWRRIGGRSEHLSADFSTCTCAFLSQNSLKVGVGPPPSPSYRTRAKIMDQKTIALPRLVDHDYWRLNSVSADVYVSKGVYWNFNAVSGIRNLCVEKTERLANRNTMQCRKKVKGIV